ncbi:signal peptidase II [Alicyclobacillus dauci]|uniref:Lipoprotein signal peptidase n=1 Tax=Alicyclobacillus dauci TaxID=1475485 RepID=A0ABY6YYD4_9BACL|nr:signal peptidase II [Alicyclobacillus dauci]WAH35515.1 signal peptidase II [Alicyclobacillus dauci]
MNILLYIIALLVYLLDQLVKWLVRANVPEGQTVTVIPNVLNIFHIQNVGGAFSIFPNQTWLFVLVALVVTVAVIVVERRFRPTLMMQFGLGFLLGGAVGNMTDRIITHSVTDFVSIIIGQYHFAIFNLADVAVDVGVLLLLINSFRSTKDTETNTKKEDMNS